MNLWPHAPDDRGDRSHFRDSTLERAVRARELDAKEFTAAMWPVRKRETWIILYGLAAAGGLLVALAALVGAASPAVTWTVMGGLVALVVGVQRAVFAGPMRRGRRAAALALGLCPSCAYPIAGLEPEADGCRVCPECGSAWKFNDPKPPPPS